MNRVGIVKMFDTWDYFYLREIIEISYLQFLQNLIQFRFYDYYKSNDQLLCITVFKNIPFLNFTSILQHSIFQIFFEQGNHFKIRHERKVYFIQRNFPFAWKKFQVASFQREGIESLSLWRRHFHNHPLSTL